MIGYKKILIIAGVMWLAATAPAVYATEFVENEQNIDSEESQIQDEEIETVVEIEQTDDIIQEIESEQNENSIQDQESDQSSDLLENEFENDYAGSSLSDNNIIYEKNTDGSAGEVFEQDSEYDLMPLADYDTYYGSISNTYVEYFRGYISKMEYNEHYVAARTGQYEYIFAYGPELFYDGTFYGSDVMVVTFNTNQNGSFSSGIQTTFTLDPGSYLVYSDLSPNYPALSTSSDMSLRQIVYAIIFIIIFYTISQFGNALGIKRRSRGRR